MSFNVFSTHVLLYVTLDFFLSKQMRACTKMKDAFIMATGLDCIFIFQKLLIKATFPFYDTSEAQSISVRD